MCHNPHTQKTPAAAAGSIDITATPTQNLRWVAKAKGESVPAWPPAPAATGIRPSAPSVVETSPT